MDISVSVSGLDVRGRGVIAAAAIGPGCAGARGGSRLLRFGVAGIGEAAEEGREIWVLSRISEEVSVSGCHLPSLFKAFPLCGDLARGLRFSFMAVSPARVVWAVCCSLWFRCVAKRCMRCFLPPSRGCSWRGRGRVIPGVYYGVQVASSGYTLFASISDAHACCSTLFHTSGHSGLLSSVGLFLFSLFSFVQAAVCSLIAVYWSSSVCRSRFSPFRGFCVPAVPGSVPCGVAGFLGFLFPFRQCLSSFGIVSVVRTVESWCLCLGYMLVYCTILVWGQCIGLLA